MHKPHHDLTYSARSSANYIQSCLVLLFLIATAFEAVAQFKISRRMQKQLDEAVEMYMDRDVIGALDAVNKVLETFPTYADAWMLMSQLHEGRSEWLAAATALNQAVICNEQLLGKWRDKLAMLEFRAGRYEVAYSLIEDAVISDSLLNSSIRFAAQAIKEPVELDLASLQGNVNTGAPEYYPALSVTGDHMIFTRQIGGDARISGQEDFFEAKLSEDGSWNVLRALVEINTLGNEGAPTVRGDGRQLIFTACDGLDGGYGRRVGEGSCDLFCADFDVLDQRFKQEVNLTDINSEAWESQPSLSADGHWLFFVRAYRTQEGRVVQDIYQSEHQGDGSWSRPTRLPPTINTFGREENPVLHSDGRTLYFASNGHAGMGGLDLFVSRRQPDGSWSQAENLGFPINSNGDENSLQVFPDGRTALFATDRDEPGNLDLWQFELPVHALAESVALWRGEVRDADSQRPIRASVQVLDSLGNTIGIQTSSQVDGAFTLTFPATEHVILQIEEEGYGFYSKTLNPTDGHEPFVSIGLQHLEIGTVLVLNDVRFERSSAVLDARFQPDLEQLARTMLRTEVRIRIAGYTDGEGNTQQNQILSEERALAVAEFLTKQGIEMSRMETIGFGMSHPIATNETPEGRAINRRTEIEIIN
ncbi:MAG: hypothetical protein CL845_00625 [Crocinitomicaceae bacterium]|nr:hypothetical protein [Crocinitomicaceae bacterium]